MFLAAGLVWATVGCGGDDEARSAGLRVSPTSGLVTTEHGQEATFEVTLNSGDAPTSDVVVRMASDDDSEGTVSPALLTFSPDNFDQPQQVTITGVDDDVTDGHTRFSIELDPTESSDSAWDGIDPADVDVLNFDNDGATITSSLVGNPFVDEGGASTVMAVALSIEPLDDVTLGVGTNDSGEGVTDVTTLTFTPDNFSDAQMVTVTGVDDPDADGIQTFLFVTDPAASTDLSFDGFDAADQSLLNIDDDQAGLVVVAQNNVDTTYESGDPVGSVQLDVRLATRPTADVPVTVQSSDASEGEVQDATNQATLTFSDANWDQLQTVNVIAKDDSVEDGEQNYAVTLEIEGSLDTDYEGLPTTSYSVRNVDDDQIGVLATPTSGLTTSEGGTQATFDVQLATLPADDVRIDLLHGNPSEGTLDTPFLTFTPLDWFVPQTVTITGVDDSVADSNVQYFVSASAIDAPGTAYDLQTNLFPTISVTNNDDDVVGIAVSPSGIQLNTSEAGGSDSFNVVLNTQPTQSVVISVASTDTTEATANAAQLTFTDADWNNPQIVTVNGVNDATPAADGPATLNIDLTVEAGEPAYMALDPEDPTVVNADDDQVGVTLTKTFLNISETNIVMLGCELLFPRCAFYSLYLNTQPIGGAVTFSIASSDTGEATTLRTEVVFDEQNWSTPQKVTVCGVNDGISDGFQPIQILHGAGQGGSDYGGFTPQPVSVVVYDADNPFCEEPNPKLP